MSGIKIVGSAIPNLPWEEPKGKPGQNPVRRYTKNPIIPRDLLPTSNSIFNSAAVAHEDRFAGVFRCDNIRREMVLHAGRSDDGFNWRIDDEPIRWIIEDEEVAAPEYTYDPRVTWLEDRYWVMWCNGFHGPTIGLGYTHDFKQFHMLENALLPYNRNGVLFPR